VDSSAEKSKVAVEETAFYNDSIARFRSSAEDAPFCALSCSDSHAQIFPGPIARRDMAYRITAILQPFCTPPDTALSVLATFASGPVPVDESLERVGRRFCAPFVWPRTISDDAVNDAISFDDIPHPADEEVCKWSQPRHGMPGPTLPIERPMDKTDWIFV
jgi:hypothetical protein